MRKLIMCQYILLLNFVSVTFWQDETVSVDAGISAVRFGTQDMLIMRLCKIIIRHSV